MNEHTDDTTPAYFIDAVPLIEHNLTSLERINWLFHEIREINGEGTSIEMRILQGVLTAIADAVEHEPIPTDQGLVYPMPRPIVAPLGSEPSGEAWREVYLHLLSPVGGANHACPSKEPR